MVVRLPRLEFIDKAHSRFFCTRVQFAADRCPKGSVYGFARAFSPLLEEPLEGSVFLRSSDNLLPDLVFDLRGSVHQPIKVEVVGRIDSVKGAIRATFESVPDVPVSRVLVRMQGGKKGLIVNSRDLCRGRNRASVKLRGHNGRRRILRPVVRATGCKKRRAKRARRAGHSRR